MTRNSNGATDMAEQTTAKHTPGRNAAHAILSSPAVLDVLCGATAAQGLMGGPRNYNHPDYVQAVRSLAKIIDRETGLPELLEALQAYDAMFMEVMKCVDWGKTFDPPIKAINEVPLRARAAIAKATGGEG